MSQSQQELNKCIVSLKAVLEKKLAQQALESFAVPMRFSLLDTPSPPYVFKTVATDFLASEQRVLLLMGDTGSGKSEALKRFAFEALTKQEDAPFNAFLPVYIDLRKVNHVKSTIIEDYLKTLGLSDEAIQVLQAHANVVFLMDHYEAFDEPQNIFVSQKLSDWAHGKVMVSCRCHGFAQTDYYSYVMPFVGVHRAPQLLREVRVNGFSDDDIKRCIEAHCKEKQSKGLQTGDYFEKLKGLDNSLSLYRNPLLLTLSLALLDHFYSDQDRKAPKQNVLSKTAFYKQLLDAWFNREAAWISRETNASSETLKRNALEYAKHLAVYMHNQGVTSLNIKARSNLFSSDKPSVVHQLLSFSNPSVALARLMCPIRITENTCIEFISTDLLNYFNDHNKDQSIQNENKFISFERGEKEKNDSVLSKTVKSKVTSVTTPSEEDKHALFLNHTLNEASIVKDDNLMNFLADQANEDKNYKQFLFAMVLASKKTKQVSVGAANAISVLNRARIRLDYKNFQGIQISGANLSYAYMLNTNLSRSNLTGVNFTSAFMANVRLVGSVLTNAVFGELPYIENKKTATWCCEYSPDGRWLAAGDGVGYVRLYDAKTSLLIKPLKNWSFWITGRNNNPVRCLSFSKDSQYLAVGSQRDARVRLWRMKDFKLISTLGGHKHFVNSVSFSPDGQRLASSSRDHTVRLWKVSRTGAKHEGTLWGHGGSSVSCVDFSPCGRYLVTGSEDAVWLWHVTTTGISQCRIIGSHKYAVTVVKFSPCGQYIVSGGSDANLKLWRVSESAPAHVASFSARASVESVSFSLDGLHLASVGHDKDVSLWRMTPIGATRKAAFTGHTCSLTCVSFSPDGKRIASGGHNDFIRVWSVRANDAYPPIREGYPTNIDCISFSPKGERLASSGWDGVRLWRLGVAGLTHEATFTEYRNWVHGGVSFSSDGSHLASASRDGTVRLWRMTSMGASYRSALLASRGKVTCVCFSPDGRYLVAGGYGLGSAVFLWAWSDVFDPILIDTLEGHAAQVTCVCFSPDGRYLATGGWDDNIRLWRLGFSSIKCQSVLKWHTDAVNSVSFSPDGKMLASGSWDHTVRLWRVSESGTKRLAILKGHTSIVVSVVFSPEGRCLASGDRSGTVRLWRVSSLTGATLEATLDHQHISQGIIYTIAFNPKLPILAVGCSNGAIYLWHLRELNQKIKPQLFFVTDHHMKLSLSEVDYSYSRGLSSSNLTLFKQRGGTCVSPQPHTTPSDYYEGLERLEKPVFYTPAVLPSAKAYYKQTISTNRGNFEQSGGLKPSFSETLDEDNVLSRDLQVRLQQQGLEQSDHDMTLSSDDSSSDLKSLSDSSEKMSSGSPSSSLDDSGVPSWLSPHFKLQEHESRQTNRHEKLRSRAYELIQRNYPRQAVKAYKKLIQLNPNSDAYHNIACCYLALGKVNEAEKSFRKSLELNATSGIHCEFGFFLFNQKRFDEAIIQLNLSINKKKDSGLLVYGMMTKPFLDKRLQQEVTPKKSMSIRPAYLAYYLLIKCLDKLGKIVARDKGLNLFNQLAREQDSDPIIYKLLSYTCDALDIPQYQPVGTKSFRALF